MPLLPPFLGTGQHFNGQQHMKHETVVYEFVGPINIEPLYILETYAQGMRQFWRYVGGNVLKII